MTKDIKVIGLIGIATFAILVGGIFLLSSGGGISVPEDKIITRNGLHWHPKLSIFINGEKKDLEDGIGLGAVHQPMHTHTEDFKDGVVHMEMQGLVTKEETKLGEFFNIWGKTFNSTTIFDKSSNSEGIVKMLVNGQENKGFENYMMKEEDSIEIRYE